MQRDRCKGWKEARYLEQVANLLNPELSKEASVSARTSLQKSPC